MRFGIKILRTTPCLWTKQWNIQQMTYKQIQILLYKCNFVVVNVILSCNWISEKSWLRCTFRIYGLYKYLENISHGLSVPKVNGRSRLMRDVCAYCRANVTQQFHQHVRRLLPSSLYIYDYCDMDTMHGSRVCWYSYMTLIYLIQIVRLVDYNTTCLFM
jgi:hypothetical protein